MAGRHGRHPPDGWASRGLGGLSLWVPSFGRSGAWLYPWRSGYKSEICECELFNCCLTTQREELLKKQVLNMEEIWKLSCERPVLIRLCHQESLFFETSACVACTPLPLSGSKFRKTGPGGSGSILSLFETRFSACSGLSACFSLSSSVRYSLIILICVNPRAICSGYRHE